MRNALLRVCFWIFRALLRSGDESAAIRTVLVLQFQKPLGCCVHGTPFYAALKSGCPELKLVVAACAPCAATLRHDPHIDSLITLDPPESVWDVPRVAGRLRRELKAQRIAPDMIFQDATNRRGLHAFFALWLRLAPTAGFVERLHRRALIYDSVLSLIDNNLRLAELAGASAAHVEPAVYFTADEQAQAEALMRDVNPMAQPVVAFVLQGSGGQRTGWHDDRFAGVLRYVEGLGYRTVFLGTSGDAATIERIVALAGSAGVSLAGRTPVPVLAALLCRCDLLITLDTGTMHIGRAVDVPMVVLAPSWQKAIEWLPVHKTNVRILRGPDRTDVPETYRLDEVDVPAVKEAFVDLMRAYPPETRKHTERAARLLSTTRPN